MSHLVVTSLRMFPEGGRLVLLSFPHCVHSHVHSKASVLPSFQVQQNWLRFLHVQLLVLSSQIGLQKEPWEFKFPGRWGFARAGFWDGASILEAADDDATLHRSIACVTMSHQLLPSSQTPR